LGERLAYFGAVGGALSFSFYLFNTGLSSLVDSDWPHQVGHPATFMHLGATAVFGVLWVVCRSGQRSIPQLKWLDVGGLLVASAFYCLMAVLLPDSGFPHALILTLISMTTLSTHAIVVPATAGRTAWVSAVAAAPVPVVTYAMMQSRAPNELVLQTWGALASSAFVAAWCALGVCSCALASRIIYGLQQQVRAATELGQYTLEEKIGEGGMGVVYRARHALLRRPTAIKLLSPDRADERHIRRFEREVQLTSLLTHPNTIAIYDFGRTPDGLFYYAMEHLDGITLEELVSHDGPQPAARVRHILVQVCSALVEAHQLGLVHRDIKPANIMLSRRGGVPDHVKVLDFGLVKELSEPDATASSQPALLGTPLYLAPEAITDPEAVGPRSDLYALGAVGYQLLTGRPVFEGQTVVEVCSKHLMAEPEPPSLDARLDVPPALERVLLDCLAKSPDGRPSSAAVLRELLQELPLPGAWTTRDAERWWDSRGPELRARVVQDRGAASHGAPATIAIDLAARSWRNRPAP
jgi:serine/threonine-protein kinase